MPAQGQCLEIIQRCFFRKQYVLKKGVRLARCNGRPLQKCLCVGFPCKWDFVHTRCTMPLGSFVHLSDHPFNNVYWVPTIQQAQFKVLGHRSEQYSLSPCSHGAHMLVGQDRPTWALSLDLSAPAKPGWVTRIASLLAQGMVHDTLHDCG